MWQWGPYRAAEQVLSQHVQLTPKSRMSDRPATAEMMRVVSSSSTRTLHPPVALLTPPSMSRCVGGWWHSQALYDQCRTSSLSLLSCSTSPVRPALSPIVDRTGKRLDHERSDAQRCSILRCVTKVIITACLASNQIAQAGRVGGMCWMLFVVGNMLGATCTLRRVLTQSRDQVMKRNNNQLLLRLRRRGGDLLLPRPRARRPADTLRLRTGDLLLRDARLERRAGLLLRRGERLRLLQQG